MTGSELVAVPIFPEWKQSSCRSENRMTVPIFAEPSFYHGLLGPFGTMYVINRTSVHIQKLVAQKQQMAEAFERFLASLVGRGVGFQI